MGKLFDRTVNQNIRGGNALMAPLELLESGAGAIGALARGTSGGLSFDPTLAGLSGLLGQDPRGRTGFARGGKPIMQGDALTRAGAIAGSGDPYDEAKRREHPYLMGAADIATSVGFDPLTLFGLGSGLSAVRKARGATGLIPFNRALGLRAGGIERSIRAVRETGRSAGVADDVIEQYVQQIARRRLGRSPTFIEAMAGAEDPADFFRRGLLLNKRPAFELAEQSARAGRAATRIPTGEFPFEATPDRRVGEAIDLSRRTKPAEIDAILGVGREAGVPEVPATAQSASGAASAPTARTFDDILADMGEGIYEEVRPMVAKRGLFGEAADEVAQEAVAKTWESLAGKAVDESKNAIGKIRTTLKGKVKNAMRDAQRHAGGLVGKGDEAAGFARYEDVFAEPSAEAEAMFSLKRTRPAKTTDVRKAMESFGEVDRLEDMEDGSVLVTMDNGKQMVAEFGQEIASPEAGKVVGGQFFVDENGVFRVRFTKDTDITDVFEEFTHGLIRTGLLDDDMPKLTRKFAKGIENPVEAEEAIVKGLKAARFGEDSVARRIWETLVALYEKVTGKKTTTGTIKRIVDGDVWKRDMASDPLAFLNKRTPNMKTRPGPLGSPAQPDTIRYSVKDIADEPSSVLDQVTQRGHVEGMFGAEEEPGFLAKLRTAEGRADLGLRAAEAGWDNLARVRKAMTKQAGGKMVHKGRAAASVLMRNLSGLLSHTKHIIETGIKHPFTGDTLYGKNMVTAIHEPVAKYLKKVDGRVLTDRFEQVLREGDAYLVSRRAVSLYEQARGGMRRLLQEGATADNPLIFRRILSDNDLARLADMEGDAARQWLEAKVESWAKTNTGLGGEGSDIETARALIAEVEADPDKLKALDAVREEVARVNEAKLRYVHAKGMISDETMESLLAMSDDYVPLQRVMEDNIHAVSAGSGGEMVKTLRGSQRAILNPVTGSMESTVNWMRRADINEVFQRWLADADPEYLDEIGVTRVPEAGGGNVKPVWIDGERTFWKFDDEDLFRSIERIGRAEPQDAFSKVMGLYKRVVREAVTHSPGFPVRNFIRDSILRSITSEHGSGLAAGFQRFTPDEVDAFIRAGGDQAGFYGRVSKAYADRLRQSIKAVAKDKKTVIMRADDAKNFIIGAWDKWGDFLSKGELQNRLAEFRAARNQIAKEFPDLAAHEVDRIAAYKARDLMDFALIGEWGRKINQFVPFFNPAVQGTAKILRTARDNPKLFSKRLMQYVGMPSVGCYLYNVSVGADKEYRNLPAYRRDLYWNFKVGNRWLVIPKPFEAGVLGTTFERAVDYAHSGDPVALQGVLPSRGDLGTLAKGMSPIDESLFAGPFRPVIEIIANKDLFRDRAIIPPWEEGLDPSLRKGAEDASAVGKFLSAITGQTGVLEDPRQWDYLLRGLGSEYGRMVTDFTGQEPTRNAAKNLTGGFVRRDSPWAYQTVQNVLEGAERKGVNRRKEHRAFLDLVRGTAEAPTRANIDSLLRRAKREEKRLERVTFDELLKSRR